MTEPIPVRVTEIERVTEAGRTVERARVVEYAAQAPPGPPDRAALPCGEHPYSPECCSPMRATVLRLDGCAPARRALPPGSPAPARRALPPGSPAPARPWWRRWLS